MRVELSLARPMRIHSFVMSLKEHISARMSADGEKDCLTAFLASISKMQSGITIRNPHQPVTSQSRRKDPRLGLRPPRVHMCAYSGRGDPVKALSDNVCYNRFIDSKIFRYESSSGDLL